VLTDYTNTPETDAEGETRTPTNRFTRPSNVRVYQFRHFGLQNFQYRKRDLNPHELCARCALNAVRLPVPPFRLIKDERDKTRTCDPYRVGVVLYRLSYAPGVNPAGLEPAANGLGNRRSIHLNYGFANPFKLRR
jgi:hypothetical protein